MFFEELGLAEPDRRLDLRTADVEDDRHRPSGRSCSRRRPDLVLVYGDTNSTLAGTRAAGAAGVPVAHVEAGLRSGDLTMPEERNRIEVDATAALLFCPDERSREHSHARASRPSVVVGDVMADASRLLRARSRASACRRPTRPGTYVVATIHREANVGQQRLRRIVEGLNRLDEPVVFPAHPRTRAAIAEHGTRARPARRAHRAARLPRLRRAASQAR